MFQQSIDNYLELCEKIGKIQIKSLKVLLMFEYRRKYIKRLH